MLDQGFEVIKAESSVLALRLNAEVYSGNMSPQGETEFLATDEIGLFNRELVGIAL